MVVSPNIHLKQWLFRVEVVPGTSYHIFSRHESPQQHKKNVTPHGIHRSSSVANSGHASVLQCCPCCTISKFKSSSWVLSRPCMQRQQPIHIFRPIHVILPCILRVLLNTHHPTKAIQLGISFSNMCSFHGEGTPSLCSACPVAHFSRVCTNVEQKKPGPM